MTETSEPTTAANDEGLYVLYNHDLDSLVTTEVFHSYSDAVAALDERLADVIILRLPVEIDECLDEPSDVEDGEAQDNAVEGPQRLKHVVPAEGGFRHGPLAFECLELVGLGLVDFVIRGGWRGEQEKDGYCRKMKTGHVATS
jgi:hypothetical protein